jgi:hypothetical protein
MARIIAGIVAIVVGVVWFFQGINVIKGSFMTGEAFWSVMGVVAILFGVALIRGARSRPADPDL